MNKPAANSSVRIARIAIAMPPENASRKPPNPAMRQSRTSARSRYIKAATNAIAVRSDSTRPACVAGAHAALKAPKFATGGSAVNESTGMSPMPCSARSQ